jgi:hypothetical protein
MAAGTLATAPAAPGPSLPPPSGAPPPPAPAPRPSGWQRPPPVRAPTTAPGPSAAPGASAEAGLSRGAVAAPAIAVAVYVAAAMWDLSKYASFQSELARLGYIILDDPLQLCIGGCHLPSAPDPWRDFPLEPWPEPGRGRLRPWPDLSPGPRPWPQPWPGPMPWPKPEPERPRLRPCPALMLPPPGEQVRLRLPAAKAIWLPLYAQYVARRLLQHRVGRQRDTRQAQTWDSMMRGGEMQRAVFEEGRAMGLCERQILRPRWTRERLWPDTNVDHIIEHQVATIGNERQFDQPWNFELLDRDSNQEAGWQLDAAIVYERFRLWFLTDDERWLRCDMLFTAVDAARPAAAGRWSLREVGDGEHLPAFRRLGLVPEDVCP